MFNREQEREVVPPELSLSRPLRVLLTEDSPADAELTIAMLKRSGHTVEIDHVSRLEDYEERLRTREYDVVLSDHNLTTWMGTDALELLKASGRDIPFVVVTATLGDEAAVDYIKQGAADYVLKNRLQRLAVVLGQVLRDKSHRDAESALQARIRTGKREWELTFDTVPDPVFVFDANCRVRRANRAASGLLDKPFAELIDQPCQELLAQLSQPAPECPFRSCFADAWCGLVHVQPRGQFFVPSCTPLRDSSGARQGCVHVLRDVSEWEKAEEASRESERRYRELVENTTYGIFRSTREGKFVDMNPALVRILGYGSREEMLALDLKRDVYHDPASRSGILHRFSRQPGPIQGELQWKRKDGTPVFLRASGREVRDEAGAVKYYEVIVEDVTQQRALEEQFRQAQKMEAVGRLAGGVAHDFNNLVAVIMGNADLLLETMPPGEKATQRVSDIMSAARRAAELTQRLLAFSRKQVLEPRVVDLNDVVRDTSKLFTRLLGEDISLVHQLDSGLGKVKVDRAQTEQALMNLVINARDAMPRGGTLTIASANVDVSQAFSQGVGPLASGRYVMLTVSDTGTGMDAETKTRLFEPFFTTKERGKGTGLGLAMVYGFVVQSGGHISIETELEKGTTFRIGFPRVEARETAPPQEVAEAKFPSGSETILIAEDEPDLLKLNAEVLRSLGYSVVCAANGTEALTLAATHPGPIDLLLTDVVMPDISGREVAERLMTIRPGTPVLYVSGYTRDEVLRRGVLEESVEFLQKPFTREALAKKVRTVIEANARAAAAPRVA